MSSDLNKVIQIGRLTRDPELRHTKSGDAVASFSLAINGYKDQVSFFNYVAWRKTAEVITEYCKKGDRLGIEGRLLQRSWEDKEGNKRSTVEITVDNVQFLTPKKDGQPTIKKDDPPKFDDIEGNPFNDGDIPF